MTLWVGRCVDTHTHTHRSLEQLSSIHPFLHPSSSVYQQFFLARVTGGERKKRTLCRSLIHPGEGHTGGEILQFQNWLSNARLILPACISCHPQCSTESHPRAFTHRQQYQSRTIQANRVRLQRRTFSFLITACTSCVRFSSQRPLLRNEAFQVLHPGVPFISFVDSFRGSSDGNSNKTTFPGSPGPTGPGPFPRK